MNVQHAHIQQSQSSISSPISVTLLLSLLAHGLAGETLNEVLNVFGIKPENYGAKLLEIINLQNTLNSQSVVKVTNIVMSSPELSQQYTDKVGQYSLCEHMDKFDIPKLVKKINDYVSSNTNGLITDLVKDSEIKDAVVVLMNTIYFKDDWEVCFNKTNTQTKIFYSVNNHAAPERHEQFMFHKEKKFNYYENNEYQHVELDYQTKDFHFGLVLPKDSTQIVTSLDHFTIMNHIAKFTNQLINLRMPKFTQESEIDLIPMLRILGINKLFDDAETTMFVEPVQSFVSMIKQKAKIIVNEVGTEAAAVTIAAVAKGGMPRRNSEPIEINANHPFSYYVRYCDVILFEGVFV